jgi:hypothetical protein
VSCAAARHVAAQSRGSLTIAHARDVRQRITTHSDHVPALPPAKTLEAHGAFRTAK